MEADKRLRSSVDKALFPALDGLSERILLLCY